MAMFDELIKRCETAGQKLEFFGTVTADIVDQLESALAVVLPPSFRDFLMNYGGGGITVEWISGIYKSDPLLRKMETVYGDTMLCRERYQLPKALAVIYTQDDEVVWCLETDKRREDGECPVVSVDVLGNAGITQIADSFNSFFGDYLLLHSQSQS